MTTSGNYPNTLSYAINDLVTNGGYTLNVVLDQFQNMYYEPTLASLITWNMRNRIERKLINPLAK